MTQIDFAVRAMLLADSAVKAIVGARVYLDALPASPVLPAVRVSKPSEVPHPIAPGRFTARVQCSCYSDPPRAANGVRSPAEVEKLATAVAAVVHTARLESDPTAWVSPSGTSYSVTDHRVANAPRFTEPVSGYYHQPVDVLVEFME